MRSGRFVTQLEGYRAFIPATLPPDPPVRMNVELTKYLSDTDRAFGRVDGVAGILPNPDLFVSMYVKHEAVFSSQIEGTQSTLEDVLEYEVNPKGESRPKDVEEVLNYVRAMNYGLNRLGSLPLSLRLLREIHAELLRGVRGGERTPGEFRRSRNWVGPAGCSLKDAEFVPPPSYEMHAALDNFEKFLHDRTSLPVLIQCGLAHAHFEAIHPFLDGNGRIGRRLITLLLCERQVLQRPLLYLSLCLKAHRAQYYDRLMAVRNDGDWEGWLKFFLRGVHEVSRAAADTARSVLGLREHHREAVAQHLAGSTNGLKLLDYLFEHPLLSARMAQQALGCSYGTAGSVIQEFEKLGILQETTGRQRNRLYRYEPYVSLFDRQALSIPATQEQEPIRTTISEESKS